MNGKIALFLCVLVVGSLPVALGQEAIPTPKPVEPPAPGGREYRPNEKYTPLDAGQDAYKRAEGERRWAVDRQLTVEQNIRDYNTWRYYNWGSPYFNQYASPYAAPYIDAPRIGWRIRRNIAARIGTLGPPLPSVLSPDARYGYNYLPYTKQPIGHEKIWTSPNSYIYKPRYTPPNKPPATIGEPPQPPPAQPQPAPVAQPPTAGSENALPPPTYNPANRPQPSGPREF